MQETMTLKRVQNTIKTFSLIDKVRLIEWIAPQIEQELKNIRPVPRQSLRGLWRGVDITAEDIAEVRREMWSNFPREDF